MEREQAEKLAQKYHEFCEWFDETTALTLAMPDQDLARAIRRSLIEMLYQLDDGIRGPISKVHAELFPDE